MLGAELLLAPASPSSEPPVGSSSEPPAGAAAELAAGAAAEPAAGPSAELAAGSAELAAGPARNPADLPIETDVPGVYLFPAAFERIIAALRLGITRLGVGADYQQLSIPPVISRRLIEQAGYVKAFPQLLGTVHSFAGDGRQWSKLAPLTDGGEWHAEQQISDLVLLPAVCYPSYATLANTELAEPARFLVSGTCFRQEATAEAGRLRSFRMVEFVTAGTLEHCVEWRSSWLEIVAAWFAALQLECAIELADDPFFGPGRKLFQAAQRNQELKLEFKIAVGPDLIQAVASANFHKDHFGEGFSFTADGQVGNTACMAFGLERIALALIHVHGTDLDGWPPAVRAVLDQA